MCEKEFKINDKEKKHFKHFHNKILPRTYLQNFVNGVAIRSTGSMPHKFQTEIDLLPHLTPQ